MVKIYDYNGLELHPVRLAGRGPNGKEIMVPCRPQQASLWAVYGLYRYPRTKDDLDVIEDFKTEGEARHFRAQLLYCFPHLRHYRPITQH
jgi:hypothetical protein